MVVFLMEKRKYIAYRYRNSDKETKSKNMLKTVMTLCGGMGDAVNKTKTWPSAPPPLDNYSLPLDTCLLSDFILQVFIGRNKHLEIVRITIPLHKIIS